MLSMSSIRPAALLLAMSLFAAGCAEKITRQTRLTDAEILARGARLHAGRSYSAAADHFQVMLEKYPSSPLAARAQLGLADARMENGDTVEAEAAFDDFIRMYPSDDNVAYALSRKGALLGRDAAVPGRDQTKTVEAIRTLERLLQREGDTPRAAQAREQLRSLRTRLAEHEVLVVRHYLKRKLPESAAIRARRAAEDFPDSPATPVLMSLQADALELQGRKPEARSVRDALAGRFPGFAGGTK